jgi:hypothetical protein
MKLQLPPRLLALATALFGIPAALPAANFGPYTLPSAFEVHIETKPVSDTYAVRMYQGTHQGATGTRNGFKYSTSGTDVSYA